MAHTENCNAQPWKLRIYEESYRNRFWSHVRIAGEDDCWEWTASTGQRAKGNHYGQFGMILPGTNKSQPIRSHVAAWMLTHGPIPGGLHVLHHCDNPPCCNALKHLFLGTMKDNQHDRSLKKGILGFVKTPKAAAIAERYAAVFKRPVLDRLLESIGLQVRGTSRIVKMSIDELADAFQCSDSFVVAALRHHDVRYRLKGAPPVAKVIEAWKFQREGKPPRYDWDSWLDGQVWQVDEGTDFTVAAKAFIMAARTEARKRGYGVNADIIDGGVVLRAISRTAHPVTTGATP